MKSYFKWLFNGTWFYILQVTFHLIRVHLCIFSLNWSMWMKNAITQTNFIFIYTVEMQRIFNAHFDPFYVIQIVQYVCMYIYMSSLFSLVVFHVPFFSKIIHQMGTVCKWKRKLTRGWTGVRSITNKNCFVCYINVLILLWTCAHKFVLIRFSVYLRKFPCKLTLLKKRAAKSRLKWFMSMSVDASASAVAAYSFSEFFDNSTCLLYFFTQAIQMHFTTLLCFSVSFVLCFTQPLVLNDCGVNRWRLCFMPSQDLS